MTIEKVTLRTAYVQTTLDICKQRGIDLSKIESLLDTQKLQDPNGRMPMVAAAPLYFFAHKQFKALGYELAASLKLTSHGLMGFGLLTQVSVAEMVDYYVEHFDLVAPFASISMEKGPPEIAFEFNELIDLGPIRQPLMELCVISSWNVFDFIRKMLELPKSDFVLEFDNPKPDYHDGYGEQLPACAFDCGAYRLRFPLALLNHRIKTADAGSSTLAAEQAQSERDRAEQLNQTVTARIRQILKDRQRSLTLAQMAAELCMAERSLIRKLSGESTSYQRLLDQYREHYARNKLLHSHSPIQKIATELGYADPANFTRAFRKWTGMTPQQLRSSLD